MSEERPTHIRPVFDYSALTYEEVYNLLTNLIFGADDMADVRTARALSVAQQVLRNAEREDRAVSKLLVHLNIDWQEEDDPED